MPAVIFDMDGVMVDNFEYHFKAWQKFLQRHGSDLTRSQLRDMFFGRGNSEIFDILFRRPLTRDEALSLSQEKEQIYRDLYRSEVVLVKGLQKFLAELCSGNIPTAIATSAPRENVDFIIRETGLNHSFSAIVDSSFVNKAKPDPEIYLITADILGTEPSKCIVMEDSLNGIKSAQRAGMHVVALTTSLTKARMEGVDLVIDDFTGIHIAMLNDMLKKK